MNAKDTYLSTNIYILAIESSCDDTAAAVFKNDVVLSNIVANQKVHVDYGGVVPELASRSHQKNIVPVVDKALQEAGIEKSDLNAIACTTGPGLLGSLLVGTSFAKSMAQALNIPFIAVHHMQAHMLAHFIQEPDQIKEVPEFPFLCLTVSGGHTQILKVTDHFNTEVLGETMDDAAGEAFDKAAKIMGLPYPGGPEIDKLAREGNPHAYDFSKPNVPGLQFSFSGLKTAFLYFLRDQKEQNERFIEENLHDLCASYQRVVVEILMEKIQLALEQTGINTLVIAGGVSANSALRSAVTDLENQGIKTSIPKLAYSTDNAAMIGITGYFKFLEKEFSPLTETAKARLNL